MTMCLRCLVSGRVQGVFFRASTREKARHLGVEVRATNLPDGRVEVLIRGEPAEVDHMRTWLWQGRRRRAWTTCNALGAMRRPLTSSSLRLGVRCPRHGGLVALGGQTGVQFGGDPLPKIGDDLAEF